MQFQIILTYLIRLYYVTLTSFAVVSTTFPLLRKNLVYYGKTLVKDGKERNLDVIGKIQVPKKWFNHFYFVGLLWTSYLVWEWHRWWLKEPLGPILSFLTHHTTYLKDYNGQTVQQAMWCLGMLWFQMLRRSYESLFVQKHSDAKMHFGHYVVGMSFYFFTALAMWIECLPGLSQPRQEWKWREILGIIIFFYYSGVQFTSHSILARNRSRGEKYPFPRGGPFDKLDNPHYLAECMIYLGIFLMGYNRTLALLLVWVFVNLGISAWHTSEWYKKEYPKEYRGQRYRMIPNVY